MTAEGHKVARIQLSDDQRNALINELGLQDRSNEVPDTLEIVRFHRDEGDEVQGYLFGTQISTAPTYINTQPFINPSVLTVVFC